jgi:D-arabinono-1,4-lactone oxidase/FAD binding domain
MLIDREKRQWTSWNGNISHHFNHLETPLREEELAAAIARSNSVRVIGNGQSSADICAGTATLVSGRKYNGPVSFDDTKGEVTVQAGMTLAELMELIESRGWALPSLPDIDSVTIGGALATGTHGTSGHLLSGYLRSMRIIGADGEIEEIGTGDPLFDAFRCSVGVLGAVSTATFSCVPLRRLALVEEPYRDDDWMASWPRWLEEHDFVRILWLPHTGFGYVILGDYRGEDPGFGSPEPRHHRYRRDVSRLLYRHTVGHPGFTPRANRILKKLFFSSRVHRYGTLYGATVTKSRNSTLELAEWSVGQPSFPALFEELKRSLNDGKNRAWAHIPMDVRFLKSDTTWLSCACGEPAVTVGCVTRHPGTADEYRAFDLVERLFLRHSGRPHWAKRYAARADVLRELWPKWDEFTALREKRDPAGKFLNGYLRDIFGVRG